MVALVEGVLTSSASFGALFPYLFWFIFVLVSILNSKYNYTCYLIANIIHTFSYSNLVFAE